MKVSTCRSHGKRKTAKEQMEVRDVLPMLPGSCQKAQESAGEGHMLRNRGLDRSALTIAIISAATPLLLPYPGSAIQHTSQATGNVSRLRRAIIPNNVVRRLEREGNFRLFLQALRDTGMQSMLETGRGPFTVFAPTDRAFASLLRR